MNDSPKNVVSSLLVAAITILVIAGLIGASLPFLESRYANQIAAYLAMQMSDEDKKNHYENLVRGHRSMWDVVPEPEVARIGQAGVVIEHKETEVRFNNAGMRDADPFSTKESGVFRAVCLGDSFVFGTGGSERDRFCNQIPVASRVVFQMDQATSPYQKVLRHAREHRQGTNLDRRVGVRADSHHQEASQSGCLALHFVTGIFSHPFPL